MSEETTTIAMPDGTVDMTEKKTAKIAKKVVFDIDAYATVVAADIAAAVGNIEKFQDEGDARRAREFDVALSTLQSAARLCERAFIRCHENESVLTE